MNILLSFNFSERQDTWQNHGMQQLNTWTPNVSCSSLNALWLSEPQSGRLLDNGPFSPISALHRSPSPVSPLARCESGGAVTQTVESETSTLRASCWKQSKDQSARSVSESDVNNFRNDKFNFALIVFFIILQHFCRAKPLYCFTKA